MVITAYVIAEATDMYELIERVNAYLDHGWNLQGGVSMTVVPQNGTRCEYARWMQAMILEKEVDE